MKSEGSELGLFAGGLFAATTPGIAAVSVLPSFAETYKDLSIKIPVATQLLVDHPSLMFGLIAAVPFGWFFPQVVAVLLLRGGLSPGKASFLAGSVTSTIAWLCMFLLIYWPIWDLPPVT